MKKIVGLLMIVGGICLGLYVGGYLMFIGGIVQIIEAAKNDIDGAGIAFGIGRVVLAGLAGVLSLYVLAIPGLFLMSGVTKKRSRFGNLR